MKKNGKPVKPSKARRLRKKGGGNIVIVSVNNDKIEISKPENIAEYNTIRKAILEIFADINEKKLINDKIQILIKYLNENDSCVEYKNACDNIESNKSQKSFFSSVSNIFSSKKNSSDVNTSTTDDMKTTCIGLPGCEIGKLYVYYYYYKYIEKKNNNEMDEATKKNLEELKAVFHNHVVNLQEKLGRFNSHVIRTHYIDEYFDTNNINDIDNYLKTI